jgi:copper chaperone CopZ
MLPAVPLLSCLGRKKADALFDPGNQRRLGGRPLSAFENLMRRLASCYALLIETSCKTPDFRRNVMGLKDLFAAHAENEGAAARHTVNVAGMHCNACEKLVSSALEDRGARNVVANHQTGVVEYEGELEQSLIAEAVSSAGFELS